ncbi:MAG: dethiobiotin synthase [Bacteroidetes bacterium]|nr:MAG: dethiobiotin synthase [Bacteroidota bacterium]
MINRYKGVIVAGIDTEVGKTLVSAMLVKALNGSYWKPVQAGELEFSDTAKVKAWTGRPESDFFPETYRLQHPMSPHAAAALEGIRIQAEDFKLPQASNFLVVELAGGLMVPLNEHFLNIDLVQQLRLPVILVSKYYLGSINHSLLSLDLLLRRSVPCLGLIFNGEPNASSREVILKYSGLKSLLDIGWEKEVGPEVVDRYARQLRLNMGALG